MRSPTPRQWTAIAIATAALPALALTAWPLAPFLANLAPETLPLSRILWGLFFAATLLASAILARSGAHGSVLWLGWLIISAWVVAIAAVGGIVLVVWLVLGSPSLGELPRLSPNQLDAIATRAFAVVAGLGGVALLMIAYRRQRTAENGEQREITKLFTERFTTASEQLGSQHAAVRLAGVHALAHLADDAPEGREDLAQMVIDVLCAYLRMPYSPAPKALPKNASKARREEHRERELECASFRQVRHTIIRVIGNHLREPTRWRGKDYDFTGVAFDGGDLSQAHFGGGHVSFKAARFAEGEVSFIGAQFTNGLVSFAEAEFTGGTVSFALAQFSGGEVAFARAQFTSGLVDFSGTEFTGGRVTLHRAQFSGGTVSFQGARLHNDAVSFYEAVFTGGEVSFFGARLSGGEISFAGVRLSEGRVSFEETQFTGSEVSFFGAHLSGGEVFFGHAEFSAGRISFAGVRLSEGRVSFEETQFTGSEVSFFGAHLSGGEVFFGHAEFSAGRISFAGVRLSEGKMSFEEAVFGGGELDFRGASGERPPGLISPWWDKANEVVPEPEVP